MSSCPPRSRKPSPQPPPRRCGCLRLRHIHVGRAEASADDVSWKMWTLANNQHTADGCQPYNQVGALNDEAGSRAETMVPFPKGTIAGNGLGPTDQELANRGYVVRTWGEADYQNNFWMANPTSQIFKDCDIPTWPPRTMRRATVGRRVDRGVTRWRAWSAVRASEVIRCAAADFARSVDGVDFAIFAVDIRAESGGSVHPRR